MLVALVCAVVLALQVATAHAHSPHDDIYDVVLSPRYEQDGTAFTISRDMFLKTVDGGETWTNIVRGLDNKYQLNSIDISEQDPRVLFMSSRGDGVYKSTDEGASWLKVNTGLTDLDISLVDVSPHSHDVVVAVPAARGLLMTSNGGESWHAVSDDGDRVTAVAFAPDSPNIVVVGDAHGSVSVSEDGGRSWRSTSIPGAGHIRSIAVSPEYSSDGTFFVGTRSGGTFRTTNRGASFSVRNRGLTDRSISSIVMGPNYSADATMWVSTWSKGAFTSKDGGASWSRTGKGLTTNKQRDEEGYEDRPQFGRMRLAAGSEEDRAPVLYLGGFDGLFRSTEGGRNWHEVQTLPSTLVVNVAVSPDYARDSTVAVSTYINGVSLSQDAGKTWKPINNELAEPRFYRSGPDRFARLFAVGFSPNFPADDTLFCAGWTYILKSTNGGRDWHRLELSKDELQLQQLIMAISPDYARDQSIFFGNRFGQVWGSTNGGADFSIMEATAPTHIWSMVISPRFAADGTLFVGSTTGVSKSVDRGHTWVATGSGPRYVTNLAVSPAFQQDQTMFAGTRSGLFVTRDSGQTWQMVTGTLFESDPYIEAVAVSPAFESDRTVLVSVRGVGLFKSADGGMTFAPVGHDLMADNQLLANFSNPVAVPIVFSPNYATDQTVYGVSGAEVFRSTDGAETWTEITPPITIHEVPASSANPSSSSESSGFTDHSPSTTR
jgi:photosystem II stability/assembly factor-like uncharacterized protein